MFGLGAGEILVLVFLTLILLGPKRIPEVARMLGQTIREFQQAKDQVVNDLNGSVKREHVLDIKADPVELASVYRQSQDENDA